MRVFCRRKTAAPAGPNRFAEAQAVDDLPGHGFVFIAAEPFKPFLQAGVFVHDAFIVGMGLHVLLRILELFFQAQHVLPGLGDGLPQRHVVFKGNILLQVADRFAFGHDEDAAVIFFLTHKAFQERRFACAVGSDEADAFAAADFKGYVLKHRMDAE